MWNRQHSWLVVTLKWGWVEGSFPGLACPHAENRARAPACQSLVGVRTWKSRHPTCTERPSSFASPVLMFGTSSFGITIRNAETRPSLVFTKQSAVFGERQLGWLSITYLHIRQPNACRDPVTYVKSDSEIPCSDLSGFSFQVIYRDAHPGGRSPLQGIPTTAWGMFQHTARDVQSMLSACIHLCSAPC